jgi:drug/metabolite transporter (DMT)-like permease
MNSLYVAVSIVGAMLSGFGFVLQQHAAEQVHHSEFLRLGLIARLVHNRRWLAGLALLVAGQLLQAWVLGHLTLSITEPLITTSLIFALLLAVPVSGQALRRTEIIGAVLLSAGVAALSLTRTVRAPAESFGSSSHWPAAAGIALIAFALVQLGRQRSGTLRAALIGTASGLILGIADAFTRRSVQILDSNHPLSVLVHWPGYAAVLAALVGLWLMQNAFNAAPLHASLPAVTAAEPLAGMVLGVLVFGDRVHVTPWLVAVQLGGVVAMVTGVVLVARAPVFRDLRLRQLPQAAREHLQHPAEHDRYREEEPCRGGEPTESGPVSGLPVPGHPASAEPGDGLPPAADRPSVRPPRPSRTAG